MTDEELKKEAEEYTNHNDWFEFSANVDKIGNAIRTKMERAYIAGAEPREKQIEIDAEQIRALQKQNGELTDKIRELEAQVEKMKCCSNCKHSRTEYEHCKTNKHEKWEIK